MELCAARPELYSNTVSAIRTPEGFDATRIVTHAADTYGVAFGVGLGEVAGKVFRIGHLGMLTDVLALSGIATAEMAMADLGLDVNWAPAWPPRRRFIAAPPRRGAGRRMRGEDDERHGHWTCRAGTTC
jgi:aspartate aminotransferase-like enzyme